MADKLQVFLSYAREDQKLAKKLFGFLTNLDILVWADFSCLRPGERWRPAIEQAIRESSYFIAMLSSNSVNKKGFVQKEIARALDILDEFPQHSIFIIPARIDECKPSHATLKDLHWVDLFPSWDEGANKILSVITETSPAADKRTDEPKFTWDYALREFYDGEHYRRSSVKFVVVGLVSQRSIPPDLDRKSFYLIRFATKEDQAGALRLANPAQAPVTYLKLPEVAFTRGPKLQNSGTEEFYWISHEFRRELDGKEIKYDFIKIYDPISTEETTKEGGDGDMAGKDTSGEREPGPWLAPCPKCGHDQYEETRPMVAVGIVTISCKCKKCGHEWTYEDFQ